VKIELGLFEFKPLIVDGKLISIGGRGEFIRQHGKGFTSTMRGLHANGLRRIDSIVAANEAELIGLTKGDLYGNIGR